MSDDKPQTYEYEPLTTNEQIRLVTLVPGSLHDPIKVKIDSANLSDCENKYDALSYAWGDHSNKVAISVVKEGYPQDTRTFQVTRNLSMALRHLRERGEGETTSEGMTLWVDALCINQSDNKEKSMQVSMMTKIYKNARRVIIWLGPAAGDSDRAMEALRSEHFDLMRKNLFRFRRAVEALARREFWTRVWVVQEIFEGKNPTIVCGQSEADWESSTKVIHHFLNDLKKDLGETMPPMPTPKQSSHFASRRRERSQRTRRADNQPIQAIDHLAYYRLPKEAERGRSWLLDMLLNLRHFGATDPRDKVFSMLGLLNREDCKDPKPLIRPRLEADYSLFSLEVSRKCLAARMIPWQLMA